jgi:hypothetical protein
MSRKRAAEGPPQEDADCTRFQPAARTGTEDREGDPGDAAPVPAPASDGVCSGCELSDAPGGGTTARGGGGSGSAGGAAAVRQSPGGVSAGGGGGGGCGGGCGVRGGTAAAWRPLGTVGGSGALGDSPAARRSPAGPPVGYPLNVAVVVAVAAAAGVARVVVLWQLGGPLAITPTRWLAVAALTCNLQAVDVGSQAPARGSPRAVGAPPEPTGPGMDGELAGQAAAPGVPAELGGVVPGVPARPVAVVTPGVAGELVPPGAGQEELPMPLPARGLHEGDDVDVVNWDSLASFGLPEW